MRRLFTSLLAFGLFIGTGKAQQPPEPLIVFVPQQAIQTDWMNLWSDDAPWQQAQQKVKVIVLTHSWIEWTPIDQVKEVVDFATAHHMVIDYAIDGVEKIPGQACGYASEGYAYPGEIGGSAKILQSLGADVRRLDIDEPMWFGSYDPDPGTCQLSIPDLIKRTALIMQEAVALFPHAIISETEPIPAVTDVATWKQDMTEFHLGLRQQLGVPIQLVGTDINWPNATWPQALQSLHTYLRQQNLQLGVIYNGSPYATSNTDWINSAISNLETIEGSLHIIPELVSFSSWAQYPTNTLPETDPTTLTWLINRYVRPRSILEAQFVGQGLHGKLITPDGKPIPGATINGFIPGVDFSQPLPTIVYQGVVPPTAIAAVVGIRLNAECNGCSGWNNVLLGTVTYREVSGGNSQFSFSAINAPGVLNGALTSSEVVGGTPVAQIFASPTQAVMYNSQVFSVTPGAQFTFTVPAGTVAGVGWAGNVDWMWGDGQGGGNRVVITPPPGKALVTTAVTNPDGTFDLYHMPRALDSRNPVTVEFDGGGGAYHSTVWTPPP